MATITKHRRLTKPDPQEANKTAAFNANSDLLEAGQAIQAVAGVSVTQYQAGYYNPGTNRILLLTDGVKERRGIVLVTAASGAVSYLQYGGVVTNAAWSWTAGNLLYAHGSTAGTLTATKPNAASRPLGVALSATEIWLFNDNEDVALYEVGGRGDGTLATGSTEYLFPVGMTTPNATESNRNGVVGAKKVFELRVILGSAPTSTHSRTFTVRKNGAGTTATVTIAAGATTGVTTLTTPVDYAAGDTWSLESTVSGTPAASTVAWCIRVIDNGRPS
jgi:hypothetical protein